MEKWLTNKIDRNGKQAGVEIGVDHLKDREIHRNQLINCLKH